MKTPGTGYVILLVIMSLIIAIGVFSGCSPKAQEKTVVVYTSVDQVFAEPILKKFEAKTGIKVKPVFDVEAAKTTGLVNRLIAEKDRPQADVFWNNEFAQTILLKEKRVLAPYVPPAGKDIPVQYLDQEGYWSGLPGRARVLLVNTNLLQPQGYPKSIFDLLDNKWPGEKIGIAYPLFGTTATQAAALYAGLGREKGKAFYEGLKAKKVRVVDGNSVVRDMVAGGQLMFGLTDSDDALEAVKNGAPVAVIIPDQDSLGTLIIPGTVALVANAPHPAEAKQYIDFLLSMEVEQDLLAMGCSQIPLRPAEKQPTGFPVGQVKNMQVNLFDIYSQFDASKKDLAEIFVK